MGWNYYFLNHNLNYKSWDNFKFTKIINKIKPDIIFIPSIFDDNIEHKNSNFFLCDSISKISSEIWIYQVYSSHIANTLIDITDEIKMKQKIIKIYNSQMKNKRLVSFFTWFKCMEFTFFRHKRKKGFGWKHF
jgi:LmbE family N-acetylglucosaminyl deacetylase